MESPLVLAWAGWRQALPGALDGTLNSHHGAEQGGNFTSLDALHISDVQICHLSELLLRHAAGHALTTNQITHFLLPLRADSGF
jgi:hypothetical protein